MEFRLRLFFFKLIKLAIRSPAKSGWENIVDYLVEKLVVYNKSFFDDILALDCFDSTEIRLNGAGLKLYISKRVSGRITMTVGGDQANMYSEFVKRANELIKDQDFNEKEI